MRFVMQVDFSTSASSLPLGEAAFENELTRLYLELKAEAVWSVQKNGGRIDYILCDGPGPRDLTGIARKIHETTSVRTVFLPAKASDHLFGF